MGFDGITTDLLLNNKFPSSSLNKYRYDIVNNKDKFQLSVDVPGIKHDAIDVDNLSASLTDGVLTIIAPKHSQQAIEDTARKIPVIAMTNTDNNAPANAATNMIESKEEAKEGVEVEKMVDNVEVSVNKEGK